MFAYTTRHARPKHLVPGIHAIPPPHSYDATLRTRAYITIRASILTGRKHRATTHKTTIFLFTTKHTLPSQPQLPGWDFLVYRSKTPSFTGIKKRPSPRACSVYLTFRLLLFFKNHSWTYILFGVHHHHRWCCTRSIFVVLGPFFLFLF